MESVLTIDILSSLPEIESFLLQGIKSGLSELDQPSTRVLSSGGKRLRPILVYVVASSTGLTELSLDVLRSCAAVEYLHVGSLVHDDSMDEALTRRGIPTVNSVEGWKHSILVGDYLLGMAGQCAAQVNLAVAGAIADAITAISIGQAIESAGLYNLERTRGAAMKSIMGKTASLLEASCRVGAICAGLTSDEVESLAAFGHQFGISFQLIDDVLDWISTDGLMGKPVQNDIAAGVYTLPMLFAREQGIDFSFLSATGQPPPEVVTKAAKLVWESGGIARTIQVANDHAARAAECIEPLAETNSAFKRLMELPSNYNKWAISTLVPHERQHLTT